MRPDNANAAAEVLGNVGYDVSVATVDVSSREAVHKLIEKATGLGNVTGLIHAAGVSPTQASPATILKVDLYGTALVLEVAQDIEQAVAEGSVPLSDRTVEFKITPVPEARVRELIAADAASVVAALQSRLMDRRVYFLKVAPVSCAIAPSVVCAALRPSRKSLSE